uniref:L-fucose mutarotase n=1 Tax=Pygocentrus nattereri TaxID=42514 RepID=A0A3B4DXY6_PYGNA
MVVLRGIPSVLTPELLYALAKMGHGDELVLADANFPVSSVCKSGPMEIRADGLHIPELLEAILKLLPLDTYVSHPAVVMDRVESDRQRGLQVTVWLRYSELLKQAGSHPLQECSRGPAHSDFTAQSERRALCESLPKDTDADGEAPLPAHSVYCSTL